MKYGFRIENRDIIPYRDYSPNRLCALLRIVFVIFHDLNRLRSYLFSGL